MRGEVMKRMTSLLGTFLVIGMLAGCGGGGSSTSPPPPTQVLQLSGTWQVTAPHSQNGVNRSVTLMEFNLNQTGSSISASQVAIMTVTFNGGPGDYNSASWSPQNCVAGPYSLAG